MCSYYVNNNRIIAFFSADEVYVYVFSVLVRTAYGVSLPAVHIPHYKAPVGIGVPDLQVFVVPIKQDVLLLQRAHTLPDR